VRRGNDCKQTRDKKRAQAELQQAEKIMAKRSQQFQEATAQAARVRVCVRACDSVSVSVSVPRLRRRVKHFCMPGTIFWLNAVNDGGSLQSRGVERVVAWCRALLVSLDNEACVL